MRRFVIVTAMLAAAAVAAQTPTKEQGSLSFRLHPASVIGAPPASRRGSLLQETRRRAGRRDPQFGESSRRGAAGGARHRDPHAGQTSGPPRGDGQKEDARRSHGAIGINDRHPRTQRQKASGGDDPRLTPQEKANYDKPGGIAGMTDKEYWDRRARGLGGNPTTCGRNLLGYPGTRYFGENIFVHEFSHAIMGVAIRTADPALYAEIHAAYKAMAKGLWKNHYASTNANEYWAEGAQTWFWSNYEYMDGEIRVQTPEDLQRYDPKLYELLSRVRGHHIPMDVYHGKNIPPPA